MAMENGHKPLHSRDEVKLVVQPVGLWPQALPRPRGGRHGTLRGLGRPGEHPLAHRPGLCQTSEQGSVSKTGQPLINRSAIMPRWLSLCLPLPGLMHFAALARTSVRYPTGLCKSLHSWKKRPLVAPPSLAALQTTRHAWVGSRCRRPGGGTSGINAPRAACQSFAQR